MLLRTGTLPANCFNAPPFAPVHGGSLSRWPVQARKLAPTGKMAQRPPSAWDQGELERMQAVMDANWRDVYALADMVAERHVASSRGLERFVEGQVVNRLKGTATAFDHDWKAKVVQAAGGAQQ